MKAIASQLRHVFGTLYAEIFIYVKLTAAVLPPSSAKLFISFQQHTGTKTQTEHTCIAIALSAS